MHMNEEVVIKVEGVSFSYNGEKVISNINLDIKRGEFLGIIGPNGSGKTTFLKVILGLLKPQEGTVEILGQDIQKLKDKSKIGYVPQRAKVIDFPISVEEVVGMGGAGKRAISEALNEVEMADQKKRLIRELSGGQQQRVFIARALALKPEILVLDEPTVGVDMESQAKFYGLLKTLNQNHKLTLVLVSHDVDVVAHEVSEIACINSKLVCHGKPHDILKSDFMEKLYGKDLSFVVHGH